MYKVYKYAITKTTYFFKINGYVLYFIVVTNQNTDTRHISTVKCSIDVPSIILVHVPSRYIVSKDLAIKNYKKVVKKKKP